MVPKKDLSAIQKKIAGIEVHRIDTLDALSVLLKCKPQYLTEAVDQNLVPAALARKAIEGANKDRDDLEAQLIAMENAKRKAEEWAYSHAATIDTLHTQLDAMEQAKSKAEEWAHSYAAEVARLQAHATRLDGELDLVKSSRAYKLLASLRLKPKRRNGDA
jgi:chromosome segregation ATPase